MNLASLKCLRLIFPSLTYCLPLASAVRDERYLLHVCLCTFWNDEHYDMESISNHVPDVCLVLCMGTNQGTHAWVTFAPAEHSIFNQTTWVVGVVSSSIQYWVKRQYLPPHKKSYLNFVCANCLLWNPRVHWEQAGNVAEGDDASSPKLPGEHECWLNMCSALAIEQWDVEQMSNVC